MSEHWYCCNSIESAHISGFNLIDHYSRAAHIHGGVAIFGAPHLEFETIGGVRNLSDDFHFEAVACKLKMGSIDTIVMVLYRSNVGNKDIFLAKLESALEVLSKYKNHLIVVCGDFNYDFLEPSRRLSELLDVLHSYNLTYTIDEPTRCTRCLDNICISENRCVYQSTVVRNAISDHEGQIISINFNKANDKPDKIAYRQINNPHKIKFFKTILSNERWHTVYDSADVETQYLEFSHLLNYHYNEAFALKHRIINKSQSSDARWITPGIRVSSMRLKELFLLAQSGDERIILFYKNYKTVYRRVIRAAKRIYYSSLIERSRHKVRTAWEVINSGKQRPKTAVCLTIEGKNCTDNLDCANHFNAYFTSVAERFPYSDTDLCDNNVSVNTVSFFLTPVTFQEVRSEILRLKSSPSCGFDGISSKLLRLCAEEISWPLTHIINSSFQTGVFPNVLKMAKCVPVYKKGSPILVENYRPLSILSTFSKVFEKLFCKRLLSFFNQCNLFVGSQHGFRNKRSTSTAIMSFLNDLYTSLDQSQKCIGVFLDLSKAFDLVNHERLLEKLYDYGVRGVPLSWIRSYLCGRSQYVEILGKKSETMSLKRGVPQGSVIGPLLYVIYTGDIGLNNIVMYADDTTLLSSGGNMRQAIEHTNDSLESACKYFTKNDLVLNTEKSVCISFMLSSVTSPPNDGHSDGLVKLQASPLSFVDETRFLGLTIDKCLKWSEHIDTLCGRVARLCYTIKTLGERVDTDALRMYYFASVHSVLSYGIVAWGSSTDVSRVLLLQKRAVRYIVGATRLEGCRPLFRRLGIMTVISVYIFQVCLNVRLCGCNYRSLNDAHQHDTRNSLLLQYPRHRTAALEGSPHYMAIRCYNKLPDSLKILTTERFKASLRGLLIQKAYYSLKEFFNDKC